MVLGLYSTRIRLSDRRGGSAARRRARKNAVSGCMRDHKRGDEAQPMEKERSPKHQQRRGKRVDEGLGCRRVETSLPKFGAVGRKRREVAVGDVAWV